MRPIVTIADTADGLLAAFDAIFAPYGGIAKIIPADSKVHIKPNGVHFATGIYTDAAVVDALLVYLGDHGYNRLALMENCTHGVSTRLVFEVNGYVDIARQHGAELIYLDEGGTVPYTLEGEEVPIRISRRLYESFIDPSRRPGNFYLSLPKLKTHSMTTMTLGVKNQQAFPTDEDRMHFHNHETLHARLARLYRMVQPDFCIIEGITAIFNGHLPPTALLRESSAQLNVLIGGQDTVAVDTVGAKVMGYAIEEVEHLRLAAEWGLGEGGRSHPASREQHWPTGQAASGCHPHAGRGSGDRKSVPDLRGRAGRQDKPAVVSERRGTRKDRYGSRRPASFRQADRDEGGPKGGGSLGAARARHRHHPDGEPRGLRAAPCDSPPDDVRPAVLPFPRGRNCPRCFRTPGEKDSEGPSRRMP